MADAIDDRLVKLGRSRVRRFGGVGAGVTLFSRSIVVSLTSKKWRITALSSGVREGKLAATIAMLTSHAVIMARTASVLKFMLDAIPHLNAFGDKSLTFDFGSS